MPDRPAIPKDITRQILVESGHRCAVCGANCPLERAHIIPWHKSKEHKVEDLICLCASCHERADLENWGEKTLREYKRRPWVLRQGQADAKADMISMPEMMREPWRTKAPRMVLIQPGRFTMGSPSYEQGRRDETEHEVSITYHFEISVFPVTQAWWEDLMGNNPSQFKGHDLPVECVSWYDAVAFCNALSDECRLDKAYILKEVKGKPGREGFRADVNWRSIESGGFRLPTEAEWEYACRAGTNGPTYGGYPFDYDPIAWIQHNSQHRTHPVGQKKPNPWGLYDMLGNVQEWCWDWYDSYPSVPVINPTGPSEGKSNSVTGELAKIHRGGAWYCIEWRARCAERHTQPPDFRNGYRGWGDSIGFRLARSLF